MPTRARKSSQDVAVSISYSVIKKHVAVAVVAVVVAVLSLFCCCLVAAK